jgi:hypothetical protein
LKRERRGNTICLREEIKRRQEEEGSLATNYIVVIVMADPSNASNPQAILPVRNRSIPPSSQRG